MDYEKAYKEALERAKNLYSGVHKGCKEVIENVFPELAESEDERIRGALIKQFSQQRAEMTFGDTGLTFNEIVSWLEKQKAKERLDRMAPIYNDKESFESALEKAWKYYNESASRTVDSFEDDYIECVFSKGFREGFLYKEKQKEQKSVECELEDAFKYYTDAGITVSCGDIVAKPKEQKEQKEIPFMNGDADL